MSAGIRQMLETGGGLGDHCRPRGLLSWGPLVTSSIMSGAVETTLFQSLVGKERSIAREVSLQRIKVGGELKICLRP